MLELVLDVRFARFVAVVELRDSTSALRASVVPPEVTPSMTTTVLSVVSTQSSARVPTTEARPVVVAFLNISVFAMIVPVFIAYLSVLTYKF
jgi:hypothetical protein